MRTRSPPRSALATPTPMNRPTSVAMKDGMRSFDVDQAVDEAQHRADQDAQGDRQQSRPGDRCRPPFSTKAKITAQTATTPSIDRSIEPMRMMKVAPTAHQQGRCGGDAHADEICTDRKLGLRTVMMASSSTSTSSGAQRRSVSRDRASARSAPAHHSGRRFSRQGLWHVLPRCPCGCAIRRLIERGRGAGRTRAVVERQRYWIWPPARPQMSFQSYFGSVSR